MPSDATIGVAGLGGMGSNAAVMLARSGVGRLVLADFDVVDEGNIARQAYVPRHVGMRKTDALRGILEELGTGTEVETRDVRLDAGNVADVFRGCDVVCEALDVPESKATVVEALLSGGFTVVACSGMAGTGPANSIVTRRAMGRLWVCGDGVSDVGTEGRLNAARVSVCAGHMALAAIRLAQGLEPRSSLLLRCLTWKTNWFLEGAGSGRGSSSAPGSSRSR